VSHSGALTLTIWKVYNSIPRQPFPHAHTSRKVEKGGKVNSFIHFKKNHHHQQQQQQQNNNNNNNNYNNNKDKH
jgi:hypothetical protein